MAELKTKKNDANVEDFLNRVENPIRREDSFKVLKLMKEITGDEPVMWGGSIVGFGSYHYKYKSGRENDWMVTGFSPRKQSLTLYLMDGFDDYETTLADLGKHSIGKSCLYIKKLSDVDMDTLRILISKSVDHVKNLNNHIL